MTSWSSRHLVAALVGTAAALGWLGLGSAAQAAQAAQATQAAPAAAPDSQPLFAAQFKDFERRQQPLAQFKGRPMLVYFWATWCKSCKQEVPELIALHKKFGNKLSVVGIAIDNADKVREFVQQNRINYPVLLGSNDAVALSKQLGNTVGSLPFAVVLDAQGRIIKTLLGETPPGRFEELVRPLVN